MAALVEAMRSAATPLLWLDDTAYTERLLAGGSIPWLDGSAYLAFRRTAQSLLRADLRAVPLAGFLQAWCAAHPALAEAMSARTRAVFPARTLLADEGLRAHLVEVLAGLRAAFSNAPLVLGLPSPRAMVLEAWRMAFGPGADIEVGADEADSCAVYVAEFLRSFGACGVDSLLLEETAGTEPTTAEELDWYRPVLNVAAHYRWDVGLRLPTGTGFAGAAATAAVQFAASPREIGGVLHVAVLPASFWEGAAPDPADGPKARFVTVPADAVPERVLARLATLRDA